MSGYTAQNIEVLEGLEPVRKRPAMYIGGVDSRGLHHLLWEIVDNAVDEYLNGHADTLTVTLHKDGRSVSIGDNGRGIPIDKHPKFKKSALELILTTLHAGGKFSDANYTHSGGLHGVGASVVNALSKEMVATVKRGGREYRQEFRRGIPVNGMTKGGAVRGTGTTIFFRPDEKIFPRTQFVAETIKLHLEDISFIHGGLKITFVDETKGERHTLSNPGGIVDYVTKLVGEGNKKPLADVVIHAIRSEGERIEAAFQWTESTEESIRSYVNGIRTASGGTHESGMRSAVVKAVRGYLETHKVPLKGVSITPDDIREGVVGVLSVFVREPQFQGQTKERLNNPELNANVDGVVRPALEDWLNNNPSLADRIIGRIIMAARARQASRDAAKEVKRKGHGTRRVNLPGKLADCTSSTKPEESELFIVEGDSAGGSAKQGRSARFQAVLPLRGKILNSEGVTHARALKHAELADIVQALGTGIGDNFNISTLRYGKIILLMDADYDGHHISTLLLTFFFRHMPELIRQRRLFIAKPPLYKIKVGKDQTHWAHDDVHREEILASLPKNARPEITRFKGLGEMPARTLSETTLKPETRTLLEVKIDSEVEADATFVTLLGKDPSLRYGFIMDHSGLADELDI
ncbi:DNA gyrase subunit B [Planctomycetes bacterium Pan216]|uniref:DNA topoisomerase (ATP-hydrolyzing) n=1 Tax=Kolteria novifilia TaxID=2527975 RepID=A0A518B9S0_9BACT|nr:DNA gyrase subunit B [Planctomycetes bacterium Pan216]